MIQISDRTKVTAHPEHIVCDPYVVLPREAVLTELWRKLAEKLEARPDYVTYQIAEPGMPPLYLQFLEDDVRIGVSCQVS